MATERELEKSDALQHANIEFDCSGHFIVYPTMVGIKLVNVETNRCIQIIGKGDNLRPLHVSLFQGRTKKPKAALSLEQEASENPILAQTNADPTLFATAFKYARAHIQSSASNHAFHSSRCFPLILFVSESSGFICTADVCPPIYKMSIEMCSMRSQQKKILSLCPRAKVSIVAQPLFCDLDSTFRNVIANWFTVFRFHEINSRLPEIVQFGNDTYNTRRHSFETVWNRVSQNGGELLCTQQKWLLQWAYIPSCYQRIYDSNG